MREAKAIYSERAIIREAAAVTCVWPRLKGRQWSGQLYSGRKGRPGYALSGARRHRHTAGGLRRQDLPCDWVGEQTRLARFVSKLEMRTRIRAAVSY